MQANSKNFSYSRNLFFDILAHIKNNAYLCDENFINNHSHNFCFNGARRCETMGIFYCLIGAYTIDFDYDFNYDFVGIAYNIGSCILLY